MLMTTSPNAGGYEFVSISEKTFSQNVAVHRLVAESFLRKDKNKTCINHIDGNKTNNYVKNLEWCTAAENARHAADNKLIKHFKIGVNKTEYRQNNKNL